MRNRHHPIALAALLLISTVQAQEQLEAVQVKGRATLGAADSASEGEVKAERLERRPLLRPA